MTASALKPLRPDQAQAVDPQIHASLSASAGTGKTQVLTARVLRLLLAGAAPETILCLTFTKAAAAEMAERVNNRLARWVRLDDSELLAELAAIGIADGARLVDRARTLFAEVLDAPGGLRIQTIHSFCQTLLASFPAEAGITPGFRPIEGREEQALIERTLAALAVRSAETDNAFLDDLQILAARMNEAGVRDYLAACASSEMLRSLPLEGIEPWLRREVDLPDGDVAAQVEAWCADEVFDCDALHSLARGYRAWGTLATAIPAAEKLEAWLALPPVERCRRLDLVASVLFTGKGERRKLQAGLLKVHPGAEEDCDALADAVGDLLSLLGRDALVRLQAAGLRAGARFAIAYADAKRAAGVADFDDLIRWSRDLLQQPGIAEWVRFKLDRRTDHLLVDEAQDTNPAQWAIIDALTEEFFAGGREGEPARTKFMVGDVKQAIYGFQGTDPAQFAAARDRTRLAAEGGPFPFRDLSISASFRSSQVVLDTVDAALDQLGFEALGLPEPAPRHVAFHAERAGRVELWPPHEMADRGDLGAEGWENEEKRDFARALADRIKALIDEAPVLASTGKPLTAGDILVLVRSRASGLAGLLVGRLFERKVPIAGLDRLVLADPFAVQDLLAAIRFAVQPLDDLSLANLLVSPLGGWSQDDLFRLARRRGRTPLWEVLGRRRGEEPLFGQTRATLEELLRAADYAGPYAFSERILSGPLDGRRKLLARLGTSASDPINELIAAALTFEGQEGGGLQGFLHWFASSKVEVKRDPESQGDAVRIMTVHGAKGLEAPVVFLVDATADPSKTGGFSPPLWWAGANGKVPLIRPRKAEQYPPFDRLIEAEKAADLREHHRLGYVAMTRAAERLVVAGLKPRSKDGTPPEQSWHAVVERALRQLGADETHDGSLLLERGRASEPAPAPASTLEEAAVTVPAWARTPAPVEARPPRPLAPSQIAPDTDSRPPPGPDAAAAAERGRLLHALFERLPATPPGERRQTALEWLRQGAGLADAAARLALVDAALAVIEDPAHAALFAPDALAEAPIAATLDDGTVVVGTVDRLLVTPDTVRVVDFKTGRRFPAGLAQVPDSHRRQMHAYGRALAVIFPGRRIELALLYTEGPVMISLPLEDVVEATHMHGNFQQESPSP